MKTPSRESKQRNSRKTYKKGFQTLVNEAADIFQFVCYSYKCIHGFRHKYMFVLKMITSTCNNCSTVTSEGGICLERYMDIVGAWVVFSLAVPLKCGQL